MARYTPLPASVRATAIREFESAMELRSNPGARTIKARRTSTCPISDEKIEVGDSITKTEAGWALTKYVRAAKSNPLQIKRGKGKFKQTAQSVQGQLRHQNLLEDISQSELGGYEYALAGRAPVRKYQQVENPSLGGAAMKYARAHGVSLKQGWAAVKAGKANPYYENPSMGGRAMQYSRAHGVSLKEGWKAVKSGLSNPYHNPSKEAEVQALARQVLRFWPKVSPAAEQQLFFMLNPEYIQGGDTINMVVASFLGNALGWRGEDARRIKAQLNALLR